MFLMLDDGRSHGWMLMGLEAIAWAACALRYDVTMNLGIDIGGTSIKLAAMERGQVVWTARSDSYLRPDTASLIAALRQAGRDRIHSGAIDFMGLCVPGILNDARSEVVLSVNVPGLMGIPLAELIHQSMGKPPMQLRVINDAIATASDVALELRLQGRVLVMALGTGVGMGVLDDGRPVMIGGESPGHIGQVDVSIPGDVPIGPDGGAGSLEAYIGVPALIQRYGSTAHFLTHAKLSDPPIQALIRALRICHAIYRPNHIVLAGGIGIRLKPLISDLKQTVGDHLTSVARAGWTLACASHDFHAAQGAARLSISP